MGATFDWTFDVTFDPLTDWYVDGIPVETVTDEVATYQTLTLRWRVPTATLESVFRPLKTDEGKVDVLSVDDGGFTCVDRANGDNTYLLTPPTAREPLRQEGEFHVARYEEDLVSQNGDEWDVEIEFLRSTSREDSPELEVPFTVPSELGVDLGSGNIGATFDWTFNQTFAADSWLLETLYGDIITDRIDADLVGTGESGVQRFELTARFTVEQAYAFETSLARLGGGRVKRIPDAGNRARDDTDGNVNTVYIQSPSDSVLSPGNYLVTEWEGRRLNDAFSEYSIDVISFPG